MDISTKRKWIDQAALLLTPPVFFFTTTVGGIPSLAIATYIFILIPLADTLLQRVPPTATIDEIQNRKPKKVRKTLRGIALTHGTIIIYIFLIPFVLFYSSYLFSRTAPSLLTTIGLATSTAGYLICACALLHELMHVPNKIFLIYTTVFGSMFGFGFFPMEHLYCHHNMQKTCTYNDPTSARLGESVYAYAIRAYWTMFTSVFRFEKSRLSHEGSSPWRVSNAAVLSTLVWLLMAGIQFTWLGPRGLVFYLLCCAGGIFNYLVLLFTTHYGLTRTVQADGTLEPFTHLHAWNCNFTLLNVASLETTHHIDHHLRPLASYFELEDIEGSPDLPAGLFNLVPIILIPPLWRRLMDPRVMEVRARITATLARRKAMLLDPPPTHPQFPAYGHGTRES